MVSDLRLLFVDHILSSLEESRLRIFFIVEADVHSTVVLDHFFFKYLVHAVPMFVGLQELLGLRWLRMLNFFLSLVMLSVLRELPWEMNYSWLPGRTEISTEVQLRLGLHFFFFNNLLSGSFSELSLLEVTDPLVTIDAGPSSNSPLRYLIGHESLRHFVILVLRLTLSLRIMIWLGNIERNSGSSVSSAHWPTAAYLMKEILSWIWYNLDRCPSSTTSTSLSRVLLVHICKIIWVTVSVADIVRATSDYTRLPSALSSDWLRIPSSNLRSKITVLILMSAADIALSSAAASCLCILIDVFFEVILSWPCLVPSSCLLVLESTCIYRRCGFNLLFWILLCIIVLRWCSIGLFGISEVLGSTSAESSPSSSSTSLWSSRWRLLAIVVSFFLIWLCIVVLFVRGKVVSGAVSLGLLVVCSLVIHYWELKCLLNDLWLAIIIWIIYYKTS